MSIRSAAHADREIDEVDREPRRRPARSTVLPVLAAALPFLVVAVRIAWDRADPVYSGDAGLLAMGVRSAEHGTRTLGPYSRFGFFHPGPALFYVLAPFNWLTGGAPWAVPLGVALLNAAVAAALVVVVQRTAGADRRLVAGAAAATVVLGYALAVDVGLLSIFWNPLQIMLPVALLLVAAARVDGRLGPVAAVTLAATFVVQTHVGTGPVAVVAVGCALVFFARGAGRAAAASKGALAIVALSVVAWFPPLWQQVTGRHGNIAELVSFFGSSREPRPGWARAVSYAGRELAVFPFRMPWRGSLTPATVHGRPWAAAYAAFFGATVLLIVVARRRGLRQVQRLGVVTLVAALASVFAVASIRGDVGWYLTAYMTAIAVPFALGWILLACERFPRLGARAVIAALAVCVVAATVVAATASVYDNRAFPNEARYRRDAESVFRLLAPRVDSYRGHTVVIGGDPALVPAIAGVALKLEDAGVGIRVTDALVPTFGPERRASANRDADIVVSTDTPRGYERLGTTTAVMLRSRVVVSVPAP